MWSKKKSKKVICQNCSSEFLTRLNGNQKFCCLDCLREFKNANVNLNCYYCEKKFIRKKQSLKASRSGIYFCSRDCKDLAGSLKGNCPQIRPSHYGTAKHIFRKRIQKSECSNCGIVRKSRSLICKECSKNNRYNEFIKKWQLGLITGNDNLEESLHYNIRKYIFEKYDSKCVKCGWSQVHPVTGKVPLTIHHIDGVPSNSVESNLELLCQNCHCLTENYGSLNKGNGRKIRRVKSRK